MHFSNACYRHIEHTSKRSPHQMYPKLTRKARLSIAIILSYILLQLHSTPWLGKDWSNNDIYFSMHQIPIERNPLYTSAIHQTTIPRFSVQRLSSMLRIQRLWSSPVFHSRDLRKHLKSGHPSPRTLLRGGSHHSRTDRSTLGLMVRPTILQISQQQRSGTGMSVRSGARIMKMRLEHVSRTLAGQRMSVPEAKTGRARYCGMLIDLLNGY